MLYNLYNLEYVCCWLCVYAPFVSCTLQDREKRAAAALARAVRQFPGAAASEQSESKQTSELSYPDKSAPESLGTKSAEAAGNQQGSAHDPPVASPEPHDGDNPRFISAQKTGVLTDVIPPASLKQLAPTLRVLSLEHRYCASLQ